MTLTHRMTNTPTWYSWKSMRDRCLNEKLPYYRNYGGRGVKICDRWLSFENFYADMGERPVGMSLDRIDVNGDYCPENCKWSSNKEQLRNTRFNRNITHKGQTRCISEWAEITGIGRTTLAFRLLNGWTVEETLETPVNTRKRNKLAKGN